MCNFGGEGVEFEAISHAFCENDPMLTSLWIANKLAFDHTPHQNIEFFMGICGFYGRIKMSCV